MERERLLIITPDGAEKTVYALLDEESELTNLLRIFLLELFSIKDIQSPKLQNLQNTIKSPIKILKNKNNFQLQTSMIISMNEIIFECKTQMPHDLYKLNLWKPLCEDLIELNISHSILPNYKFSVFAIKNIITNKHNYFIDLSTMNKLKDLFFMLSCFLEENYLKKSFTKVYKKVMNNSPVNDILEQLESLSFLKTNESFLMNCVAEYKQPELLLTSLLQSNILDKKWNCGNDLFKQFSSSINPSSDYIKDSIIQTYNKFLLYVNLNNNLNSCQNKQKCSKI
jgi:hypothetical protein